MALRIFIPAGLTLTTAAALGSLALPMATTATWTGAVSDAWAEAGNWSPAAVPGAGDMVALDSASATQGIRIDSPVAVAGIVATSMLPYLLHGAGSLTLGGSLSQNGSGTVSLAVPVRIAATRTIDGTGSGAVVLADLAATGAGAGLTKGGRCPLWLTGPVTLTGSLALAGTNGSAGSPSWNQIRCTVAPDIAGMIIPASDLYRGVDNAFDIDDLRERGLQIASATTATLATRFLAGNGARGLLLARGAGTVLRFTGRWNDRTTANPFNDQIMAVMDGARLVLAEGAVINNNAPDLINARPFHLVGDGLAAVVDHDPLFDADHTGYVDGMAIDDPAWVNSGMSTVQLASLTYRTRHTRNLPSVHKKSGSVPTVHTEHGLITFARPPVVWEVVDTPQVYQGGVPIRCDATIRTLADLTVDGVYGDAARVTFGPVLDGITVTKAGPATLTIDINQGWRDGCRLDIAEGVVAMATDPAGGWIGTSPFDHATVVGGRRTLDCRVAGGAGLHLRSATAGLARLEVAAGGAATVAAGTTARIDAVRIAAGADLRIDVASGDAGPRLRSASAPALAGRLTVAGLTAPPAAPILIVLADEPVTAPAESVLPPGTRLRTDGPGLWLEADGVAGNAPPAVDIQAADPANLTLP
jgi:hypothetical protein